MHKISVGLGSLGLVGNQGQTAAKQHPKQERNLNRNRPGLVQQLNIIRNPGIVRLLLSHPQQIPCETSASHLIVSNGYSRSHLHIHSSQW